MADAIHIDNFKSVWDNQRFAKATSKVEEVTGIYAQHLLTQAGLQDYQHEQPLVVFDNACGGAILTLQLQAVLSNRSPDTFKVACGDLADAMVELAKQRVEKEGWINTTVAKVDAEVCVIFVISLEDQPEQDTKFPDENFTHVFTNFGLMAFAKPSEALSECYRILRPGGLCAFTTWGTIPWLADMKAAMESVPGLPALPAEMDVPNIFSKEKIWHNPEAVRQFTAQHNFVDVESRVVHAVSVSEDSAELRAILKTPFTLMTRFFWTQEQRDILDTPAMQDKIFAWFDNKLQKGPIEWNWSAVVTTSRKPS